MRDYNTASAWHEGAALSKEEMLKQWNVQASQTLEFGDRSSLDPLIINVRWLKEWRIYSLHTFQFMFPYTAIWLVTGGAASITLNQITHTVRAGDIVCIPSQTFQTWGSIIEKPFHYLSFACEAKVGTLDFVRLYRFPSVVSSVSRQQFDSLVEDWHSIFQDYNAFLEAVSSAETIQASSDQHDAPAARLLDTKQTLKHMQMRIHGMEWMLHLLAALHHVLPDRPVAYDSRVYQVCEYVTAHLSEELSLDRLAGQAALSKEQLRALFKSTLGLSPMKYVRQSRLQRAEELLTLTTYSIKEIASLVGFENQHHFSRAFMQHCQKSPMAYRAAAKK